MMIDYNKIAHAINVAQSLGYKYVEIPPWDSLIQGDHYVRCIRFPEEVNVELVIWKPEIPEVYLERVIQDAMQIMRTWAKGIVRTKTALCLNGVEIGTYGMLGDGVYGTGIAEPRFSTSLGGMPNVSPTTSG